MNFVKWSQKKCEFLKKSMKNVNLEKRSQKKNVNFDEKLQKICKFHQGFAEKVQILAKKSQKITFILSKNHGKNSNFVKGLWWTYKVCLMKAKNR